MIAPRAQPAQRPVTPSTIVDDAVAKHGEYAEDSEIAGDTGDAGDDIFQMEKKAPHRDAGRAVVVIPTTCGYARLQCCELKKNGARSPNEPQGCQSRPGFAQFLVASLALHSQDLIGGGPQYYG